LKVIVVGSGKIVYYLARQFSRKGIQASIVTPHADEAKELSRRTEAPVLVGDATDPLVLKEAGAWQAHAVLALSPNDEDNLAICQIAGRMYRVPRTIALVNDPENEEIFHRLQVTVAISATRILSLLIEEQAGFEEISRMMAVGGGSVSVSEVVLRADAPAVGVSLKRLTFPEDALLGGIIRGEKVLIPKGATHLQAGDRLILIATPDSLDQALRMLTGEESS
jgi:trk system potassium uptake protein TrkA